MEQESPASEARNGNDQSGDNPTLPIGLGRRGRPPGSKNKNRPINLGGEKEAAPSRPQSNEESIESAKFIGAALVSLVELAETVVHNSCEKRIEKKRPQKSAEFRQILEGYKLKDKEREMMADAATKIAVRHDWLTKFAPEVVLAVTLGQYSLRQLSLIKFVGNVTGENKTENVTPSPVSTATAENT